MRKIIVHALVAALKESFSVDQLKKLQKMVYSGELSNVFEDAIDKSLESKIADDWQQENQRDT